MGKFYSRATYEVDPWSQFPQMWLLQHKKYWPSQVLWRDHSQPMSVFPHSVKKLSQCPTRIVEWRQFLLDCGRNLVPQYGRIEEILADHWGQVRWIRMKPEKIQSYREITVLSCRDLELKFLFPKNVFGSVSFNDRRAISSKSIDRLSQSCHLYFTKSRALREWEEIER